MKIEVKTLSDCREDCPFFSVSEGSKMYAGDRVAVRNYKCANMELCRMLSNEAKLRSGDVPAADVVEVVRCKDCEHYEPYPTVLGYELGTDGCCTAPWLFKPFRVQEKHYCSWGKRKEEENE